MTEEKQVVPPPPDESSLVDLHKYRAHASEVALYSLHAKLKDTLDFAESVLKQVHELNKQFPLGDDTPTGTQQLAIKAIRAAMPEMRDKTDTEVLALFAGGKK
jgi:hypothetical protein